MYSKLPLKYIGITNSFGMRKNPINGVSAFHYGVDLGWNKYQGEPVYAANSGKVLYEGYDNNLGNYLVLKYKDGKKTIINRYLHLKNKALVRKGENVIRGKIIGYMGSTGYSTGVHLHFEYWICPDKYTYKYSDRNKYAKDPLKYCYLFDDQDVASSSLPKIKRVVGNPVKRDKIKNQIQITGKYLNCRALPSLKAKKFGYVELGYYNILDSKTSDGYVWYKIDSNKWVAYVKSVVTRYLVEEKTNVINSNNDDTLDNFNLFIADKDDYFYIKLKKNEKLYFTK